METRRGQKGHHPSGIRTVPGTPVHGSAGNGNNRATTSRTPSSGGGRTPAVTPGTPAAGRLYPGGGSTSHSRISLNSNQSGTTPSPHAGSRQLWIALYEYIAQGEDELK